jgi:hypothetical protein
MKTFSLDDLVRAPSAVKNLTAKGERVQVTEAGKPLWVVSPANNEVTEEEGPDEAWWNEYFAELETEPVRQGKSAAQILIESRGNW